MGDRALVLGGGGVAGVAWTVGIIAGLADGGTAPGDEGVDVRMADLVVGTSAGALVGAHLRPEAPIAELFRQQTDPRPGAGPEPQPEGVDVPALWALLTRARREAGDDLLEQRRGVGAVALGARTVAEAARRAAIADRLALDTWPDRDLRITAVDAHSGEEAVFTRESGVPLVDAVAASTAVPGVWPPVSIGGRRYVDGGVRTMVNADLAAGFGRILVIAPSVAPTLDEEVALLERDAHAQVVVIAADEASQAAFGTNPLDPATRRPSALAGFAQGSRSLGTVREAWLG